MFGPQQTTRGEHLGSWPPPWASGIKSQLCPSAFCVILKTPTYGGTTSLAGDSRFADLGSVVGGGISEQCALEAGFEF